MQQQLGIELYNKFLKLEQDLKTYSRIAVAFSGGVDSTLLLKIASDLLGDRALGIYADSPLQPARERVSALNLAKTIGIELIIFSIDKLSQDAFRLNPSNRCYLCKGFIFDEIIEIAKSKSVEIIVDGSNHDDLSDYRPGAIALKERGIKSPLCDAGLTKLDIRLLSKYFNLPTWEKDALACLATRIPTGDEINIQKLKMVDQAEEYLVNLGFRNVRARHFGNTVRLEVRADQIPKLMAIIVEVEKKMKILGFIHIEIDQNGYRQGNMNAS